MMWLYWPEFLGQIKSTYSKGASASERSLIFGEYEKDGFGLGGSAFHCGPATATLTVIDDIGSERETEWSSQILRLILTHRINELLPTIVTSNFLLKEIAHTDPRLASRLGAMSYLKLPGPDRRLQGGSGV